MIKKYPEINIKFGNKPKIINKKITVRNYKSAPKRKKKIYKELSKLRKSIREQGEGEPRIGRRKKSRKPSKGQSRKKSSKKRKPTNKHKSTKAFSKKNRGPSRGRNLQKNIDTQSVDNIERSQNYSSESPARNLEENELEAKFESESSIFQLGPEHFLKNPNDRINRERESESEEER